MLLRRYLYYRSALSCFGGVGELRDVARAAVPRGARGGVLRARWTMGAILPVGALRLGGVDVEGGARRAGRQALT